MECSSCDRSIARTRISHFECIQTDLIVQISIQIIWCEWWSYFVCLIFFFFLFQYHWMNFNRLLPLKQVNVSRQNFHHSMSHSDQRSNMDLTFLLVNMDLFVLAHLTNQIPNDNQMIPFKRNFLFVNLFVDCTCTCTRNFIFDKKKTRKTGKKLKKIEEIVLKCNLKRSLAFSKHHRNRLLLSLFSFQWKFIIYISFHILTNFLFRIKTI